MKRILLAVAISLLTHGAALADSVYISDRGGSHVGYCEDAYLWAKAPDCNYGGITGNWVGDWGGGDINPIWRFGLSDIPDGSVITSAKIWINVDYINNGGNVATCYQIADANNGWNEGTSYAQAENGTACWNDHTYQNLQEWAGSTGLGTAGTDYLTTPLGSLTVSSTGIHEMTLNSDGLDAIEDRLNANDIEFVWRASDYSTSKTFRWYSSEAASANRPYLYVEYTPPDPPETQSVYISDRGGSHVGYCHDNTMNSHSIAKNYNYGGANQVIEVNKAWLGDTEDVDWNTIWRFDLTDIPEGATITYAKIWIKVTDVGGGGNTATCYQIAAANNDWNEGTSYGETETKASCWEDHTYENQQEWAGSPGLSTAGTDYINTSMGSLTISTTGDHEMILNSSGLEAIENRLDDGDIELLWRASDYSTDKYVAWHTSETLTTTNRPFLYVEYTPPEQQGAVFISDRGGSHVGYCDDTYLWANAPNYNYGGIGCNWVGDWGGGDINPIWRFGLSDIPDSANITSAKIWIRVDYINNGGNAATCYQIAEANNGWGEGNSYHQTETGAACWNDHTYQNLQEWAGSTGLRTAGTDYVNTPLGSLTVSSTGIQQMTLNSDGLDAIESRLDEDDIEFVWIASDYSTSKTFRWYSSQAALTNRPYLYVEYEY